MNETSSESPYYMANYMTLSNINILLIQSKWWRGYWGHAAWKQIKISVVWTVDDDVC